MELAVNYSPQALALLTGGALAFDRWKCSDWPELITGAHATRLPCYVHFALQAGPGTTHKENLDRVAAYLAETGTHYVNLHLEPLRVAFPSDPVESLRTDHFAVVIEQTLRDVSVVADRFGADRIVVENLPYRGPTGRRLRMAAEPEIIQRVCDESGGRFLLDIAPARSAAHHLNLDERNYLSSLPVDRLTELHVSGVDRNENRQPREHMPMGDDDWSLVEWRLSQIHRGEWARPWVLAFEYGGIGPLMEWRSAERVLAEQGPRLAQLVEELRN